MPTFYIARHGATVGNERAVVLGHADSPLSAAGFRAAERLACLLSGERIIHIVTSDLGRASATAHRIAMRLGFPGHRVERTALLRETDYGHLNGLPRTVVRARFPAYRRDLDTIHPGGESLRQTAERVRRCLSLLERSGAGRVLLVTHGGPIRVILGRSLGLPLEDCLSIPLEHVFLARIHHSRRGIPAVSFLAGGTAWAQKPEPAAG